MLFDPNIEPRCDYCRYGSDIGENEIACSKFGIFFAGDSCRKFKYDPLKREPERKKAPDSSNLSAEDFEL